jgi:cytidyltransferase-like protein
MSKKLITVAISGAFDPIHVGHIRYIREAAKLGDRLIVILNSDDFLMNKKGFVFYPFEERKGILQSISGVDEVVAAIDHDQTVRLTLEKIKPDIFAKGPKKTVMQNIPEEETCRKIGCKIVTNVGGAMAWTDAGLVLKTKELGVAHPKGILIACLYCDDHPMLRGKCLYCGGTGKMEVPRSE